MLAERRHVEEEALRFSDGNLVELLLSLPIFDVHGGSDGDAPDCIGLSVKEHWLAPAETDDALLDERFVRCSGADEEGLLRFAGVRQLGRAAFLLDHVFPRLDSLPETTRDGCLLGALHSLHALSAEDGRFRPALAGLRFVPTASGGLRCPSELFHPDVSEARELLDADDAFPHGAFADAEVLSVLERLGLRSQVTRSAVVQSARSVESLAAAEPDAAARRAKALLRYVDMNAPVLLEPAAAADPAAAKEPSRLERARGLFSTTSTPTPPPPPHPSHDVPLDEFLHELSTLAWVPVLTEPPLPLLPWDAAQCARCFAPPSAVRPVDEMWLVSYSCRLLDGEARSDALRRALGWHTRPNLFVLAAQLSALAAHDPYRRRAHAIPAEHGGRRPRAVPGTRGYRRLPRRRRVRRRPRADVRAARCSAVRVGGLALRAPGARGALLSARPRAPPARRPRRPPLLRRSPPPPRRARERPGRAIPPATRRARCRGCRRVAAAVVAADGTGDRAAARVAAAPAAAAGGCPPPRRERRPSARPSADL